MDSRPSLPAVSAAAVAFGLGVAGALVRPAWHDEYFTLELAARSCSDIVGALRLDSGPPGYYFVCRTLWVLGFDSLIALRLFSVAAAAVTAGLTVAVAARRGPAAAWIAAALVAPHPLLLAAASDARAYALLAAIAAGALLLAEGPLDRRRAGGLTVVLAVGCWLHSLGLLLVGGCFVATSLHLAAERRRAWIAVLVALILHLPWLPIMAAQPAQALAWMTGALERAPAFARWLLPVIQVSPSADLAPWLDVTATPVAVVIPGAAVWLLLLVHARKSGPGWMLLTAPWAAMALVPLLVTLVARPLYFPGRIDTLWLCAAVTLAASGASHRRGTIALAIALAVAGSLTCVRTLRAWNASPPGPEHLIARTITELVTPGDRIVLTGWWWLGVRHSLGLQAERYSWSTFPHDVAAHPGWYDDRSVRAEDVTLLQEALASDTELGHLWLLRTPGLPSDRLLDIVVSERGLVPRAGAPRIAVLWGPPRS